MGGGLRRRTQWFGRRLVGRDSGIGGMAAEKNKSPASAGLFSFAASGWRRHAHTTSCWTSCRLVGQTDAEQGRLRLANTLRFAVTCFVRIIRIQRQVRRREEV